MMTYEEWVGGWKENVRKWKEAARPPIAQKPSILFVAPVVREWIKQLVGLSDNNEPQNP